MIRKITLTILGLWMNIPLIAGTNHTLPKVFASEKLSYDPFVRVVSPKTVSVPTDATRTLLFTQTTQNFVNQTNGLKTEFLNTLNEQFAELQNLTGQTDSKVNHLKKVYSGLKELIQSIETLTKK